MWKGTEEEDKNKNETRATFILHLLEARVLQKDIMPPIEAAT
jgi:hypothetical protein